MAKKPASPKNAVKTTDELTIEDKVRIHARIGTKAEVISILLSIDVPTLIERYGHILKTAAPEANGHVGNALYTKAMNGDTQAQIFWMKSRAKWKETVDFSSDDGSMSVGAYQNAIIEALKKTHDGK